MTDFPKYELKQGERVCFFDASLGIKDECNKYGFGVEVLKDGRVKIRVDGHSPKVYSAPDCDGHIDEYYCSYPVKVRAVERDVNPWWCKLQLKRVCEEEGEEKLIYRNVRVFSDESKGHRPKSIDIQILEKYPQAKAFIDGVDERDRFVCGALTAIAIDLARAGRSDSFIAAELKKTYTEMKKKFEK